MNNANQVVTFTNQLPSISSRTIPVIDSLVQTLGFPRTVLASDEEITYAWQDLPRELHKIPVNNVKPELIARMCVAISCGLFDSAINYIWNASILRLREKVRNFGLPVVAQILEKDFEDNHLISLQDSQLLDLCLQLNILNEEGALFLGQCRTIRNNFSAAHPSLGNLNDREFIIFLNRCVKYALEDASSPRGINVNSFIQSIKGDRFNMEQLKFWEDCLRKTHQAQRNLLITMTYGLYCDPNSQESVRLNALDVSSSFKDEFSTSLISDLIDKHSEYITKGDEKRKKASNQFFEKLGLLKFLDNSQQHTIFSLAIQKLQLAHDGLNNFYNEPPHAERLADLSKGTERPQTVQSEFVDVVVSCYLGNGYGVSWNAMPFYESMIKNFSPNEIAIMLKHTQDNNTRVGMKVSSNRKEFKKVLQLIDEKSVASGVRSIYDQLM